jgi:DNA cross-link repair 1C protein
MRIYTSLTAKAQTGKDSWYFPISPEAAALAGHMCGNTPHAGCLTREQSVRLHSCERGNMCEAAKAPSVVLIKPLVARLPGGEGLIEAGVGGGGGDLESEAELDFWSEDLQSFIEQ